MRVIKANAQILAHEKCSAYLFIERVGRTCYKSEDQIEEGSDVKFVKMLTKRKHMAMLEHEHLYFLTGWSFLEGLQDVVDINDLRYFNITSKCISGSFRSFFELFSKYQENTPLFVLAMYHILCKEYPEVFDLVTMKEADNLYSYTDLTRMMKTLKLVSREELEEKLDNVSIQSHLVHTALFVCDRGVSHELVRHRPCAFGQESTRYCNYSQKKYGDEITVIEPLFFKEDTEKYDIWHRGCEAAEKAYFDLIASGATAQEARDVLPTSVKTEIAVTATESEWKHIINLRYHGTTGAPHPQMQEVMNILYPQLSKESHNRL